MLKNLNIENIAVIEKADIELSAGLNVLTGETGAGKSIVVDSINAVLGERTSRELVRHGADAAYVSALFDGISDDVKDRLTALGMEAEDELLITRRITAQGKSSCRINGAPCTVSMLREIGSALVNIHGQHDSQALLNPEYHYRFIDMLGVKGLEDYQAAFQRLRAVRKRLKALTLDVDERDRQLELLNYEIAELSAADIKVGEREALKNRRNVIRHSQAVTEALNRVIAAFNGDDEASGIETLLASAQREAESISTVDSELKELYNRFNDLTDVAATVKDMAAAKLAAVDFSEQELEQLEERLDMYYRFSNKYGDTEEDMLAYLDNAIARRNAIVNSDEELEKLNEEYDGAFDTAVKAADALSQSRRKVARELEQRVKQELQFLDMPKIEFVAQFTKGNLSATGYDKIEFLISTNPGEPPKPLSKIASGGELSRIMLAIKKVIAANDSVGTLIFDEIDTGVSGKASRKIGYSLQGVSEYAQVICVTHSAQIASLADNHLLISKRFDNDRTYTSVTSLDYEARKHELARIMGGLEITDTLLHSAQELLSGN